MRYEDRRQLAAIAELRAGMRVTVAGTVVVAGLRRARRMMLYEVRVEDGTGRLKVLWFNQPYLKDVLPKGSRVVLYGSVEPDAYGSRQLMMSSPQFELSDGEDPVHTGRIVPVYEKLGGVSGKALRRVLTALAEQVPDDLADPLPELVRGRLGVVGRGAALRAVHVPVDVEVAELNAFRSPAHRRLILEELFLFQLGLARRRHGRRGLRKGLAFAVTDRARDAVKRILPFHLTGAQKRVLREIAEDMSSPHPMNRLVQGDVGSGKTMVALLSMVIALENGYQAAFMAPTEILAEQHFARFLSLCRGLPVRIVLLTSSLTGKPREELRAQIREGEAHIVIGTHALIQEGVEFRQLGLGIVDEQHRFGVLQRAALRGKAKTAPHLLVMTATPIPRTLAMTLYGDLDVSVIDEMPPGRTPVETRVVPERGRGAAWTRVRKELAEGGRVYIVLPLVEESEKLTLRDATKTAERVREAFPEIGVGLLHGRMKAEEKEEVMRRFQEGEIRILVSTTVVEVGIDVPEATVMLIEHAERFGLSQLHQLRGRVGRGSRPSVCFLFVEGPQGEDAVARLSVMERTTDGFAIAEEDLKIRGPGDFAGVRQSGIPDLVFSDIVRDARMLSRSREIAAALLARDPGLAHPEHAALARWIASKEAAALPTVG
jgi:ATP-dependent DNA helicase RecG